MGSVTSLSSGFIMDSIGLPSQPPLSNGRPTPLAMNFTEDEDILSKYIAHTQQTPVFHRGNPRDLFSDPDYASSSVNKMVSSFEPVNEGEYLDQTIQYLNHEIMSLGMPSLFDGEHVSVAKLVNAANKLLRNNQGNLREKEQLENKMHRSSCDLSHVQQSMRRMQDKCDQLERDLATAQTQLMQGSKTNRKLNARIKGLQEAEKKLQSTLQHREAQYKHDTKKREREAVKLKDRLHQLLNDRGGLGKSRTGIQMSSTIPRAGGRRGTWNIYNQTKHEEDLYKAVLTGAEDKLKQVLVENTELRRSIAHMQQELVTILHSKDATDASPTIQMGSSPPDSGNDDTDSCSFGTYEMPFDLVSEDLHRSYSAKIRKLKQVIRRVDECNNTVQNKPSTAEKSSKDVGKLQRQVNRYKKVIEEQEKLIQQSIESQHAAAQATLQRLRLENQQLENSSVRSMAEDSPATTPGPSSTAPNPTTPSASVRRQLPSTPSVVPKHVAQTLHVNVEESENCEDRAEQEEESSPDDGFEPMTFTFSSQEPSTRARPHSAGPTTNPFTSIRKTARGFSPGVLAFTGNPQTSKNQPLSPDRHSVEEHVEAIRASLLQLGEDCG
ncbi:hypothetical protein CAPTEDRAFT_223546 [Capitella teleta]|uniref:Uncharacterized protein n=1 Tax=Capitella teleta TaxID=283909 RepID=R7TDC9_CAPTE|nr:hypothetical protein CAPTEDRAFT_223546 [Capitella teleta]|eukprot:ELT89071.1 hypothetical protein CAPTEDRAFT_223546 [Capitella teleta]